MNLPEEIKEKIIQKILEKKQYSELDFKFIEKILNKTINSNPTEIKKILSNFKFQDKTEFEKFIKNSKEIKKIIKITKAEIGERYGQFLTSKFLKKEKILNNIDQLNEKNITELLKLHKSTRERINYYEEIYSKIFEKINPNSILDLACGLNPISIYYIEKKLKKKITYSGYDLNKNDMEFLNKFFKKFNFKGNFKRVDLTNLSWLESKKELNEFDCIFLLKTLDSLEKEKKNISKEILANLISLKSLKYLIISFPTKSIKAKQHFHQNKRNWFFKFLEKNNLKYETFEIENELFIIIYN